MESAPRGRTQGEKISRATERNPAGRHSLARNRPAAGVLPQKIAEAVPVDVFGTGQCPADARACDDERRTDLAGAVHEQDLTVAGGVVAQQDIALAIAIEIARTDGGEVRARYEAR